jgi:hypothetical protein
VETISRKDLNNVRSTLEVVNTRDYTTERGIQNGSSGSLWSLALHGMRGGQSGMVVHRHRLDARGFERTSSVLGICPTCAHAVGQPNKMSYS